MRSAIILFMSNSSGACSFFAPGAPWCRASSGWFLPFAFFRTELFFAGCAVFPSLASAIWLWIFFSLFAILTLLDFFSFGCTTGLTSFFCLRGAGFFRCALFTAFASLLCTAFFSAWGAVSFCLRGAGFFKCALFTAFASLLCTTFVSAWGADSFFCFSWWIFTGIFSLTCTTFFCSWCGAIFFSCFSGRTLAIFAVFLLTWDGTFLCCSLWCGLGFFGPEKRKLLWRSVAAVRIRI